MKIRKTGKKLLIVAICSLFPLTAGASFNDVSTDNPQYEAISALEQSGTVTGYSDGTFKPEKRITKAELLTMLFRHINYQPTAGIYNTPFEDVPADSWFAPYVQKGLQLNIVNINPNFLRFSPNTPLNRIDAFHMIGIVEGVSIPYINTETTSIFKDATPGTENFYLLKAAEKSGIYIEKDFPYFNSQSLMTRGDTAEMLYRAAIYRGDNNVTLPLKSFQNVTPTYNGTSSDIVNNPKFPLLVDVWDKINKKYANSNEVNKNQLIYGAIDGLVESLDDPYTVFESPNTATELQNAIEGSFEGIGTVLDTFQNRFIIINVLPDSPAEKVGLQVGDIITKVDGNDVSNMDINELIKRIKGPTGTTVRININRDGKSMDFTIKREKIVLETVVFYTTQNVQVPEDIGYIVINQFTQKTGPDFHKIVENILAKKPKGIIIDLRDNPGGFVSSAYEILENFLQKDETMATIQVQSGIINEKAKKTGDLLESGVPIIVLVNQSSASASEIMAGALQDYNRATIIGEQTFGKGTVQELTLYNDGSLFKFTIAHWLTPNKRDIDKKGITPDIVVKATKEDFLGNSDTQLERAIQELQKI